MIGIVVTGHGHFASGLTSSVELIGGKPEHYHAVDFVQEDSTDDLEKIRSGFRFLEGLHRWNPCIYGLSWWFTF